MNAFAVFFRQAVRPRSADEDRARREFIFNVLALSALALLLVAIVDNTLHSIFTDGALHRAGSLSSLAFYGLFVFFAALYALSLRGRAVLASFIFLAALFDLAAYMGYRWGVDLSASLLFYALVITMAGILISAQFAFVTAFLAGIAIAITTHLHRIGAIQPDRSWITELWKADDVVVATLIFLVIATVMWLSNREIEKSLVRARRSEADLKRERDMLEVRVQERTAELQQAELERMTQAYRFVEFGRLASGVFHDLMNPLAGLTLNIDRIANAPESRTILADDVERAKLAAAHMQDLLGAMRRHLKREIHEEVFSVRDILTGAVKLVATRAREHNVECVMAARTDAQVFGDAVALTQAVVNLLGNAIQAYPSVLSAAPQRTVQLTLRCNAQKAVVTVQDFGSGIPEGVLPHIFEPYFTTKEKEGIGLGLSLAKRIVEKDFSGALTVESGKGEGTIFMMTLPLCSLPLQPGKTY